MEQKAYPGNATCPASFSVNGTDVTSKPSATFNSSCFFFPFLLQISDFFLYKHIYNPNVFCQNHGISRVSLPFIIMVSCVIRCLVSDFKH